MTSYSLAIDIGGTFTDVVLRSSDGVLWSEKTLSTHHDLLEGFFRGVQNVLRASGIPPEKVEGAILHATTMVTNALIERKGTKTALLVTEGFEDVLVIRAEHRYDLYDLQIEFADPIIPADLTFGVKERVLADGSVKEIIDGQQVAQIARSLKAEGVRSVAICLLNAYRNPANEQRIAALLSQHLPGIYISLSSDIAPQIREYPRASTTAINAYTMPIAQPYLRALTSRLQQEGFANKPLIMLSAGGVVGAELAGQNPVRMIESGPAAGSLAASHFARRLGIPRLMSFDMGGTTAKACLIEDGKPLVAGSLEVDRRYRFKEGSGMPVVVPAIDLIEIGAGGGSIASVDPLGLLKVGPRSAGSEPGPACYGRGGEHPTVTDADLLLGLLDADNFLGGDMRLDIGAALQAYSGLGKSICKTAIETAAGVYRIVAQNMAAAARTHATDRGVDHRGIPLLAFGGAGPVHACQVGDLLQSTSLIFPPSASVLSAFGTLVSPTRLDLVRSVVDMLSNLDWEKVDQIYKTFIEEACSALMEAGSAPGDIRFEYGIDLRYAGQQSEIAVTLPEDPRASRSETMIAQEFEKAYLAHYGVAPSHVPVQIVNWRLAAFGRAVPLVEKEQPRGNNVSPKKHRTVHLWGDLKVPVFDRHALVLGQTVKGPALIEERETTTVIQPGWRASKDASGCLVADRMGAHA